MSKPGLNHDTAARLLDITPAELEALVRDGIIQRNGRDDYALPILVKNYIDHLRGEQNRRERAPKQIETASHVDLSDRSVREWETKLQLQGKAYSLTEFRIAYIRALREEAAGRSAIGDLDLATERAKLTQAQCKGQEIKNAVALGTYAQIELLSDILASAAQAVVDRLDQIPASLRRSCPELPSSARDAVMAEIASSRNEMIRKTTIRIADMMIADALDSSDAPIEDESDPLTDEVEA